MSEAEDLQKQIAEIERQQAIRQPASTVGNLCRGIGMDFNRGTFNPEECDWDEVIERIERALENAKAVRELVS